MTVITNTIKIGVSFNGDHTLEDAEKFLDFITEAMTKAADESFADLELPKGISVYVS